MSAPRTPPIDVELANGNTRRIEPITPYVFRVRLCADARFTEPGLVRYGIVRSQWPEVHCDVADSEQNVTIDTGQTALVVSKTDGAVALCNNDGEILTRESAAPVCAANAGGFRTSFELSDHVRLYGLGDETRDRIQMRGHRGAMMLRNVASYIPIPFLMSTGGWAVFMNTTWFHAFDAGATHKDRLTFSAKGGELDFYLIAGATLPELLDRYTQITGRPALLPQWAYGLTFVCDERGVRARDVLYEAYEFRRSGIPCDLIGLEPDWMETRYDFSTDKKWSPERFHTPFWLEGKDHGTFMAAMRNMGFKVSLWLCCDYDLSEYEEQQLGAAIGDTGQKDQTHEDDLFQDQHFATRLFDTLTKAGEPWFEHLKKFVDDGASAFKLDGANQVCMHPDRKWKNGMQDEEMHNLYPLLLNKQMTQGFREHTGRRPMIYSAGGYAGIQQYSATWAGDTGGGKKPLVSLLNHGLSGHSNVSCDMEVWNAAGIHFGFLQPWSQVLSWHQYNQPWFLGDRLTPIFRYYAQLRYRLLPYIYSAAYVAARTGLPILRAMPLVAPDDPKSDELLHQYMLGDALLTAAFTDHIHLPEGGWVDYWTGAVHHGPQDMIAEVPEDRGGPLFVRAGAIVPMAPPMDYVGQKPVETIEVHVFQPHGESAFTLYEDDGATDAWKNGACAETRIHCQAEAERVTVRVHPRRGVYAGMPGKRSVTVCIHGKTMPRAVRVNGVLRSMGDAEDQWTFAEADKVVHVSVAEDPELDIAAEVAFDWE